MWAEAPVHKTMDSYIQGDNVMRAAEFLLLLDNKAIQPQHHSYAFRWLQILRDQFELHYKRTRKEYWVLFNETTRPTLIAQSFERLQDATLRMSSLLTHEVKQQLFNYLSEPNAPLPTFLFKENEEEVTE